MKSHKRLLQWIFAGVLAIAFVSGAFGQTKTGKHVKVPAVPARPEDVSSPERIVLADYESISGGVGVPRQWARDFALYDPRARFFLVEKDAKTGGLKISAPTFEELQTNCQREETE